MTTTTRAAQITFLQSSDGHRWTAQLMNPAAFDVNYGPTQKATMRCVIKANGDWLEGEPTGYTLTTDGGNTGGRRHRYFRDLHEAQKAAIAWAGRRFRIAVGEPA